MKKIFGIVLAAICVFAFSAPSYALLIANINPNWGGSYTGNSLTGTARVDIFTDFDFDKAILNVGTSNGFVVASSFSTLGIITPTSGWSITSPTGTGATINLKNTGTPATQHLAFTFDFTLTKTLNQMAADVAAGTAVWSDFFSSNDPWSLNGSVTLGTLSPASFSTNFVPEPATLILLGTGLLGAGVLNRKKRKGEKV